MAEYSGINTTAPLDVTATATGTSTLGDSGFATTTNANDLLVGSSWFQKGSTGPGTGYTQREISGFDGNILEDRIVGAIGAYNATGPQSPSGAWVMQMAAFKGSGGGGGGYDGALDADGALGGGGLPGLRSICRGALPRTTWESPDTWLSGVWGQVVRPSPRSLRRLGSPSATPA